MITMQQIRQDLKEIRYYYSQRKELDAAALIIGENAVVKKAKRYNLAIDRAPLILYRLYYGLYVMNNSQSALAYDWDKCVDYIKQLNGRLCDYLADNL
ncbi:MAG: hypothetical protein K2M44_00505 [Clostridia bacterium]|nr:hypothetical protein [Clostridia bacterium]